MKCTYKDERQEVWQDKKRRYSLVDIRILPRAMAAVIGQELTEAFQNVLDGEHSYEVADVTNGVEVLGKFKTNHEAMEFLRSYHRKEIYKLKEKI